MIDQKSLSLSIYDYYTYCRKIEKVRAVGVITNSQFVFYSQINESDYKVHNEIFMQLENIIHKNNNSTFNEYRTNDVYIASLGNELIIFMPTRKALSHNQYLFLCDILDQIIKFNEDKDDKIYVYVAGSNHINDLKQTDLQKVKEQLSKDVKRIVNIEDEQIIGTTIDSNVDKIMR